MNWIAYTELNLSNKWYCGSFTCLLDRGLVVEQWIVPKTFKTILKLMVLIGENLPKLPELAKNDFLYVWIELSTMNQIYQTCSSFKCLLDRSYLWSKELYQKPLKINQIDATNRRKLPKICEKWFFWCVNWIVYTESNLSNKWYCGSFICLLDRGLVMEQWIVLKLMVLIGKNCPKSLKLVKNGLFDVWIELFTLY